MVFEVNDQVSVVVSIVQFSLKSLLKVFFRKIKTEDWLKLIIYTQRLGINKWSFGKGSGVSCG